MDHAAIVFEIVGFCVDRKIVSATSGRFLGESLLKLEDAGIDFSVIDPETWKRGIASGIWSANEICLPERMRVLCLPPGPVMDAYRQVMHTDRDRHLRLIQARQRPPPAGVAYQEDPYLLERQFTGERTQCDLIIVLGLALRESAEARCLKQIH